MRAVRLALAALLGGCAALEQAPRQASAPAPETQRAAAQAPAAVQDCRPEIDRVNAQLQAEIAERQRLVRAAARREETLRKQLDAMKAIERGILEREEKMHLQAR